MQYEHYGTRELINLVETLEAELTQAYEKAGMTPYSALMAVREVITQANNN